MTAESNVGARLLLIGKDGVLAGLKEITAATARLNAEIAAGAKSSAVASAGYDEQMAGLARLGVVMDSYEARLAASAAGTDALARVGKVAFFSMAAAGAAWTYESIKWATQYQTQLTRLRTQAGLTVTAMNAIGKAAMSNAAALGTTPTAYVTAAYHPASTGYGAKQTIAITNNAAKLAAIGGGDLEDTVNSITGLSKIYGLNKKTTPQSMTAFVNAVIGAGNMRVPDFNSALSTGVFESGKTFGISKQAVGGILAYLTDRTIGAAQAGTRTRMGISLLGAPSAQAVKDLTAAGMAETSAKNLASSVYSTLSAAGLSTTQLSYALRDNKGGGGIVNALSLLHKKLDAGGMDQEAQAAFISKVFGGGRTGSALVAAYQNLPGLAQKTTQIDKNSSNKKFMEDWAATTKTLNFQLHSLGGEFETIGTQFGQDVLPTVSTGIRLFTDLLKILDKNKALAIGLGTAVTAVLVPAIGVYLYRALLSSGGAIRTVIRGYGGLISGQTAEQLSLARTDASLAATTGATERLAGADAGLAGSSRTGGLAGLGGGMGGMLIKGAALAGGGYLAGSLIRGKNGATLSSGQSTSGKIRTVGGDIIEGAGIGAGIGTLIPIPGLSTALGAGIGAVAGGVYGERHQIGSALDRGWDDLFGGGGSKQSSATPARKLIVQNHITVEIDGKKVTKAVTKRTKATAALSG